MRLRQGGGLNEEEGKYCAYSRDQLDYLTRPSEAGELYLMEAQEYDRRKVLLWLWWLCVARWMGAEHASQQAFSND